MPAAVQVLIQGEVCAVYQVFSAGLFGTMIIRPNVLPAVPVFTITDLQSLSSTSQSL